MRVEDQRRRAYRPIFYVDLRNPAGIGLGTLVYNYDGKIFASDEGRMRAEMRQHIRATWSANVAGIVERQHELIARARKNCLRGSKRSSAVFESNSAELMGRKSPA